MENGHIVQYDLLLKIYDQAPYGIVVLNKKGDLLFWNSFMENMTGYYRKEFGHFAFADLIFREEADLFEHRFKTLRAKPRKNFRFQTRIRKNNGTILAVEIQTNTIADGTENAPLYVFYIRDIRKTKARERKQKSLVLKLQRFHSELIDFAELLKEKDQEEYESGGPDYGMTKIDDRIIEFILQGYMNSEIADELNLAVVTIKKRISKIYKKLGVKRRGELIEFFRSG